MRIVISVYFYLGKNTGSLFTYYDSFVLMLGIGFVSQQTGYVFFMRSSRAAHFLFDRKLL